MKQQEIHRIKLESRDRILETILSKFATDPILSEALVLRGGGAMHFVHGSPRYSADLDYACADFDTIAQSIIDETTKPIDIVQSHKPDAGPVFWPLKIEVQKNEPDFLRVSFALAEQDLQGSDLDHMPLREYGLDDLLVKDHGESHLGASRVVVEIKNVAVGDSERIEGEYGSLLVTPIDELYADKLSACVSRMIEWDGVIKGTDLFDLEYLAKQGATGGLTELREKAALKGESDFITVENLQRLITITQDPRNQDAYCKQIKKTMAPIAAGNISLSRRYIDNAVQNHLVPILEELQAETPNKSKYTVPEPVLVM